MRLEQYLLDGHGVCSLSQRESWLGDIVASSRSKYVLDPASHYQSEIQNAVLIINQNMFGSINLAQSVSVRPEVHEVVGG